VPTLNEALGLHYSVGAWRGIGAPKGLPADISAKLTAALKAVYDSKDYQDFMNSRGFGMKFADGPGFASFMAESDKSMASAMKAAGLAKG